MTGLEAFLHWTDDQGMRVVTANMGSRSSATLGTLFARAKYGGRKGRRALIRIKLGIWSPGSLLARGLRDRILALEAE